MSQLQVTTLESNTVSANVITAGQTTVNSTGLHVSLPVTKSIINTSSIALQAQPYLGYTSANLSLAATLSLSSITFKGNQLPVSDFDQWAASSVKNKWEASGSTLVATNEIGPEGTPVYKLTENTGNSGHFIVYDNLFPWYSNPDVVPLGTTYTMEITVKASGRNYFLITMFGNFGAYFRVSLNSPYSYVGATNNPQCSMQDLGNGWYKCFVHAVAENPGSQPVTYFGLFPYIYLQDDAGNGSYQGDGSSGILVTNCKVYKATRNLIAETVNTQIFTANSTWTKPAWANTGNELVVVHMWGGGGGGSTNASAGYAGGGGAFVFGYFKASQCNATCNVVVGLGGTAAANGNPGGISYFYANTTNALAAYGGEGGNQSVLGGGNGGGWLANTGPLVGTRGTTGTDSTFGGGGGCVGSPYNAGSSVYGGGGGGASGQGNAGSSVYGGGGGGGIGGSAGTSVYGGRGGVGLQSGFIPAGGGAYTGNGARGEVRVYTYRILA